MRIALLIFGILATAAGKIIKHTDCGKGEVVSVDVVPCETEPCMWKKNEVARMTAKVINSVEAKGGTLRVTVDLGGVEVEYPGIDPNICNKVSCPIKKDQAYTLAYDILVEDYFPEMETDMKWVIEGTDGEGVILCASARVGIKA